MSDAKRMLTSAELNIALVQLKETMPEMCKFHALIAEQLKAKYDGLVEAGFTEAQALELCKHGV